MSNHSTYRASAQKLTERARVPVRVRRAGISVDAFMVTFHGLLPTEEHVAVVFPSPDQADLGDRVSDKHPLVRVHSECLTGDIFASARCDCGDQLDETVRTLAHEGGLLIYLRQEGRGIGLYNKLDAYELQDRGEDTFEANRHLGRGADERQYDAAAQILFALSMPIIRLLTNNPDKVSQLRRLGIDVGSVYQTRTYATPENRDYLAAKAGVGHRLSMPQERAQ